MFFYYFFQKSLFTENYFLIAAINLATRGPLYTCLVRSSNSIEVMKKAELQVAFARHSSSSCEEVIKEAPSTRSCVEIKKRYTIPTFNWNMEFELECNQLPGDHKELKKMLVPIGMRTID